MPPPILLVDKLLKRFSSGPPWRRRSVVVLDGIDLTLGEGEILVLLGANGAGKSTLLRILASLVTPDAGTVQIAGSFPGLVDTRPFVGFASGEERSLFFRLSGRQNLRFFAALHGLDRAARDQRIADCSAAFDLDDFLDRRVDRCSSGMRARLGLARALLHAPKLLLLDEPTKSLDPEHAATARRLVKQWANAGNAAIVATHLVAEAEELGTRIGLLGEGRLKLFPSSSDWKTHVRHVA